MITKRRLKDTVAQLTYRVAELEERLCPCETHKWVQIDYFPACACMGDGTTIFRYKCRNCGKTVDTWKKKMLREEIMQWR